PESFTLHELSGRITLKNGKISVAGENIVKVRLVRARTLSDDEAWYRGSLSGWAVGVKSLVLRAEGTADVLGVFEVDLSGGECEPIDLARSERVRPEITDAKFAMGS